MRSLLNSRRICNIALWIVIVSALPADGVLVARAYAQPPAKAEDQAAALERLVRANFGLLTPAEVKVVRGAPRPNIAWAGPDANPDNPANDAARGDQWGKDRTIRAALLRWLSTDPEALRYVHLSGLSVGAARIDEQLDLSYLKVPRPLLLVRCYIPRGVDISYAELQGLDLRKSRTGAIAADLSKTIGDVSLRYGTYGPASFFRAQVGGNLDCRGATISAGDQEAFSAAEAMLGGDALFHEAFTTDGLIDFRLAKVGRSLSFHGAHFTGGADNGLTAERATIAGTLYWVEIQRTPRTKLDLENLRAGSLWDDQASWPAAGNLMIDGFVYDDFSGGPGDAVTRLKWLALEPPGYRPQPYQQLAKVLREAGREEAAADVLIEKQVERRRFGGMGALERAWNVVLEATIGYGYRPLRALWWIAAFVLLGTALFGWGYRARIITPTDENAYQKFVATGIAPPHYPPFHALVYSLENFLPVVELHQGNYWRPNPRHGPKGTAERAGGVLDRTTIPGALLRWYLWIHILAGWTLTPLLFAGLAGLVRVD